MKMRFGYSVDLTSIVSRGICRVTDGDYAHCFAVFDEAEGDPFYFESISKTVKHRSEAGVDLWKDGVRGPVPLKNLEGWAAEKPTKHIYELTDYLPFTDEEIQETYRMLCIACHDIQYATLQCANNWVESRLGIYATTKWFRNAGTHWNCSETLMRTCIPPRFWHYYRMLDIDANRIVPDGKRMVSIRQCTKTLLKEQES